MPGLLLEPAGERQGDAKLDLTLTVVETPHGLLTGWSYAARLFDAATVERAAATLETVVSVLAADPAARLSALSLLPAPEESQLLAGWTGRPELPVSCLPELFAEQAARTPERAAVVCAGEVLTYGALDRRANQVARWLRRRGVGPEHRVGLCVERSLDTVVGILGILKAGGAYVPLDPAYPGERLAFLVADARLGVLISQERLLPVLPRTGAEVLFLDADRAVIEQESDAPLASGAVPANLAYVIYTSGSTGRPKGSLLTHANVARLFAGTRELFTFVPGDVWTLFHSFAFDFSVWEIWGALLFGGRLVVVPWEVSRSPEAFHGLLLAESVTMLSQTPSAFRQLVPLLAGDEGSLRVVVFGGEALEPATLGRWLPHARALPVNMYGITETTVHVTYRELGAADLERPGFGSPVGRPLADLSVVLLDRLGRPVPVGAPGEIHVGGAGLMRGYLNYPELTAERLIPSPFGDRPGERLYRAGDLARLTSSGELEYLGRIDHQVKVRGFRIEPGEIEAALTACPGVTDAVVELRGDLPGGPGLAAYVASPDPAALSATGLRESLRARLPEYMVPSWFALLPALPLTVHGKVDRRALAHLDTGGGTAAVEHAAPRTPVEELLAGIFAEVLGRERVGIHEDFFALGGHSLLATQVVSRIRSVFGRELPLRALFERPAVSDLAGEIEVLLRGEGGSTTPPLVAVPA